MKRDKLFIIKKYIMAPNAASAIRKDKTTPVDDCWVDDDWRKNDKDRLATAVGFKEASV